MKAYWGSGCVRGCIQKFRHRPPGTRTPNGTALCHQVQFYRYFVSQSSEFCSHNLLCCFSTSVYCCLFIYRLGPETFGYTLVAPCIFDLGTTWRWVVSFTAGRFTPRERAPGTHCIGGSVKPRDRSGRDGEEKNSEPLQGLEAPILQPLGQRYTTELSRLLHTFLIT
jgi:hypothetical protein